jgi:hypothetical protein
MPFSTFGRAAQDSLSLQGAVKRLRSRFSSSATSLERNRLLEQLGFDWRRPLQ